jgi:hypothetical protein
MSGKEIKKKKHLFGLRIRFPPAPPSSEEPTNRVPERASHEIIIKGRKSSKPLLNTRYCWVSGVSLVSLKRNWVICPVSAAGLGASLSQVATGM